MKSIMLLMALVGALAFNTWWHAGPRVEEPVEPGLRITNAQSELLTLHDLVDRGKTVTLPPAEVRVDPSWRCVETSYCQYECRRLVGKSIQSGGYEIVQEETTVECESGIEMDETTELDDNNMLNYAWTCDGRMVDGEMIIDEGSCTKIEEGTHIPDHKTAKPDRFPPCEIHEWTCLKVGNPCSQICSRPTDDERYHEGRIIDCNTWPDLSPACEL